MLAIPPLLSALGTFAVWKLGIAPLHKWQPKFIDLGIGALSIYGLYLVFLFSIELHKLKKYIKYLIKLFKTDTKVVTSIQEKI